MQWKSSQAFCGLPPAKLVEESIQSRHIDIMLATSTPTIGNLSEGCRIRILNSPSQAGQHEVYGLAFQPKGSLESAPRRPKAKE